MTTFRKSCRTPTWQARITGWRYFGAPSILFVARRRTPIITARSNSCAYWALAGSSGRTREPFTLFQLFLCAGTVWLLFLLGRELLGHDLAAFAGALLWALHPLHVEVVAWIAALPDAGAAFFMIGSFRALPAGREGGPPPAGAPRSGGAGLFPRPFLQRDGAQFSAPGHCVLVFPRCAEESWSRRGVRWMPYALVVAGYVAARIAALGRFSAAAQSWKISLRMIAVAIGVLGQQAKFFFWPVNLNLARTFDLSASLLSPWPWLTLLVVLAAFVLRKRQPVLGFLVAWWAITLLPCLDVRQVVGLPMADRFSYLPSIGPCLAIAFGAMVLAPQRLAHLEPARLLVPALFVVLGLWTVQDIRTVPNWHDDAALWNHTASAAPDSALAHMFLGIILEHQKGDLNNAAREYETALRLNAVSFNPTAGMVYECDLGLGRIALMKGHTESAVAYFEKAVHVAPVLSPAYRALGALYFPQGNYARAAQYFIRAVQIDPQDVEARFFLGTCWMKLGKPGQAAQQFHAAREVDPTYSQAYMAESAALEAAGDKAGAARVRAERGYHGCPVPGFARN